MGSRDQARHHASANKHTHAHTHKQTMTFPLGQRNQPTNPWTFNSAYTHWARRLRPLPPPPHSPMPAEGPFVPDHPGPAYFDPHLRFNFSPSPPSPSPASSSPGPRPFPPFKKTARTYIATTSQPWHASRLPIPPSESTPRHESHRRVGPGASLPFGDL